MEATRLVTTAVIAVLTSIGTPTPGEGLPTSPLREQLAAGQRVKVEGVRKDRVFQARQVTLRDPEITAKVEGAIDAVSTDRRQIQLLGFDVTLDAATRMYRGSQPSSSRSILVRGAWVEAKGFWQNGILKATRIRLKDAPEATEEIEGPIESSNVEASTLVILNRRIVLEQGAALVDERTGRVADEADRLKRDDDDPVGRTPIAFGNVVLGGRVEAGFLDEENLEIGRRHAERTLGSRVQLLISSQMTSTIEAYTKVSLSRSLPIGGVARNDADLSEAYLMFHRIGGGPVDLQVGRQRFRDAREWFYDEYLDAARVHITLPAVKIEAAVSQGVLPGDQATRARRDELQLLGSATARLRSARLGLYAIARRDTTRAERPTWFGAAIDGDAGGSWRYWVDAAVRRGRARGTRLAGWAVDGGLRHRWNGPWSPTVTLGHALGSGDRTQGDGVDTRFRQTDLEDNHAYFGGLRRIAIYGELFDPELSNIQIFTAGFSLQPRRGLAMDAIYHYFAQATANVSLPSGNLAGRLTGRSRQLGHEMDVVLTLRATRGLDIDLACGLFVPGAAFGGRTGVAFFWRPQARFSF